MQKQTREAHIQIPCTIKGLFKKKSTTNLELLKTFDLSKGFNSELIPLVIHEDIFDRILKWYKNELKIWVIIKNDKIVQLFT